MKVELDNDEAWNLLSHIVVRMLDETPLADSDRAKVRRWKSDEMRVTSQEMRVLTSKINDDLAKTLERKSKSQLRRPDWV
jgi:hypothetical protein